MNRLTELIEDVDSILTSLAIISNDGYDYVTKVERAYELKALVTILKKFIDSQGRNNIINIISPIKEINLNGGAFDVDKCFRVSLVDGSTYFFTTDVECLGISYNQTGAKDKFEADIIVVKDLSRISNNYPLPEALHAAYECKFGAYKKSQLRELLGLKRHLSLLQDRGKIEIKIIRPAPQPFFNIAAAVFFDVSQDII